MQQILMAKRIKMPTTVPVPTGIKRRVDNMEWLEKILKDVENKDEIIKSIKKGIGENFVSKADFNAKNETVKTLEQTVKDRDEQLETLKSNNADVQSLKDQIEQLQKDNTEANEKYQADIKDMTLTNAIKLAVAGKVHDEDLVSGLFNKDKLVIDDGKIIGLDEQLEQLQKDKGFLFKASESSNNGDSNDDLFSGFKFGTGQQEDKNKLINNALDDAFGVSEKN